MKSIATMAAAATLLVAVPSHATSECFDPPVSDRFDQADVVAVATVEAKSIKQDGTAWRQTILWRVDENFKGIRYKGSTFTSRVMMASEKDVMIGQAFLLTLSGREPYQWITCDKDRGLLQKSLDDVRVVQEIFDERRRPKSVP